MVVAGILGGGENGELVLMGTVSVLQDERLLEMDGGDGYTIM